MHGRQSEERQRKRHMWPVSALATVGDSSKSLSKDGRKISTGDCALFQAGNAPPFIGIIRCLTEDKEGQVKLGVNWLYRPADVKLGKGVLLEAAPNEVFYSFHKDEISAASLLHPCKVAFLRKGVELPSGVSSFVCRRVYDTTNKCLWWLTDQDYTDERQSEVDQLLDKTRHEMHAVIQSGGPSPKENGMSSALKTGSDNVQNGSFPSQVKGKKRERSDHNTDPVKRERLSRSDASEPGHIKLECSNRPEGIAKITNKDGSLINSECVGQLVHLMQLDRNDATKKGIDLALWRKELVGVVATTDRDDCLSQFVQLRGLPILDDWLQEAHKGKTGDIGSPKESDKVVEELLITLLHALGKLPVDLDALKTCNVGKSVNHLRNHKNADIQKKARNLVDTWKKRVDEEMKINDTKSGSSQGVLLPCKQAPGEMSHAQAGRRGGPAETVKSSMPLNSSVKAVSNRSVQTDILSRTASAPSASVKVSGIHSSTISSKDSHCKEEKSSSSSQSQNNSQSWSSEPGKVTGSSWKEDARSSTAGSLSAKGSSTGSRHRKSNNCMVGSVKGGSHKEGGGGKVNVLGKNTCEKTLQSGHATDKATENGRGDNASSHRLIVKLPNPGRSPAPSVNGGTTEDMVISASRGSSPITSEKNETNNVKTKVKAEVCHGSNALEVNTESWQSNEVKDGFTEGEDGDRLSTGIPSEDRSRIGEEIDKTSEASKTTLSSASAKEIISTKGVVDAEISRACEKVQTVVSGRSRAHVSKATCRDDGAMKLLANVAACEPSKDEQGSFGNSTRQEFKTVASLAESTIKCSIDGLNSQAVDDEDDKSTIDTKELKDFTDAKVQLDADNSDFSGKSSTIGMSVHQKNASDLMKDLECPSFVQEDSKHPSESIGMAPVSAGMLSEHKYVADGKEDVLSLNKGMDQCTEQIVGQEAKEISQDTPTEEGIRTGKSSKNDDEQGAQLPMEMGNAEVCLNKDMTENTADGQMIPLKEEESGAATTGKDSVKANNCVLDLHKGTSEYAHPVAEKVEQEADADEKSTAYIDNQGVSFSCSLKNNQIQDLELRDAKQVLDSGVDEDKNMDVDTQHLSSIKSIACAGDNQAIVTEKEESVEVEKTAGNAGGVEVDETNNVPAVVDRKITEINARTDSGLDTHESRRETCNEEFEIANHSTGLATNTTISSTLISQEEQQIEHATIHSIQASELDGIEKIATETVIPAKGVCEVSISSVKCDFDLNEGFAVDETNQDEAVICSTAASMVVPIYSAPETPMSNPNGLATPIPVAIKAKGPLMPPASPLRSNGDTGWRGSAATSAFRPAEPRKTQHVHHEGPSLNDAVSSANGTSGSQSRPHLDIDLNVPDEGVVEDGLATHLSARVKSSELATASGHDFLPSRREPSVIAGRLNLDLNRVEDCEENDPVVTNTVVLDSSLKTLANGLSHKESQFPRGFDLNDGPIEDSGIEPVQWNSGTKSKGNSYLPSVPGWKMNSELVHATSWLPPGNVHSGLALTSLHSDRNERAYPVVATGATQHILSSTSGSPYCNDSYKGAVLGSSSAIAYPAAAQPMFQYGGFSFASSLPFAANHFSGGPTSYAESSGTACFPTVSAGAPSSCARPYMTNLADMPVTEGSRKLSRPILDLNAGPGTVDLEVREDRVASRQFSIADGQPSLEQQQRAFYQTAGSGISSSKRKEPEGGWDLH